MTTFAGTGTAGKIGDKVPAISAQLNGPQNIFMDVSNNLYIADSNNYKVRKVFSNGIITTFAGSTYGNSGNGGKATNAQMASPADVSIDISGNTYISDISNHNVRMVNSTGTRHILSIPCTDEQTNLIPVITIDAMIVEGFITTITGTGSAGITGDGGPATSALLNYPSGVSPDIHGNLYIADNRNHKIRIVNRNGIITTFAGTGEFGNSGDGGPAASAKLLNPQTVRADMDGNIYIADSTNAKIRLVNSAGIITTIAGTGGTGITGDGGPATSALLNSPRGVSVDRYGNVFIADNNNHKIRMVSTTGIITTIAGTGTGGSAGDGGAAASAQLYYPSGVLVDMNGNVYISDKSNQKFVWHFW